MGPGSDSRHTDIHQEGMFIPPLKLFEEGKPNTYVLAMIMANIRNPSVGQGDLRAQYASCLTAERRLHDLIFKYGFGTMGQAIVEIMDRAEMHTRARISEIPDGFYSARDCLDGDGISMDPRWIDARITIAGSDLEVDLTSSDGESWWDELLALGCRFCGPICNQGHYGSRNSSKRG